MADPLSLLRQYHMNKKLPVEKDDLIVFGDQAYRRTCKTSYIKYGTGKDNAPREYYTLECLLFFLKNLNERNPIYVKKAVEADVPVVNLAHRKEVLMFLNGELNTTDSIDRSAPLEMPIQIKRLQEPPASEQPANKKQRLVDPEQIQKERERKERLDSMLNATSQPLVQNKATIRDLSATLTAEKIVMLKTKRQTAKRHTIRTVDEDLSTGAGLADSGRTELDVSRHILTRERVWRDRATCLESQAKNFHKSVLPLLQTMRGKEDAVGLRPDRPLMPTNQPNKARPGHTQYNRYAQEALTRDETGDFKIDTLGTYHGITLKSITEGARPKQALPRSTTPTPEHPSSGSLGSASSADRKKRTSRTPIIIIPAATTSLITMYNCRELLQDLKFVSTESKKAQGARRENQVLIQRQKAGLTVPYQVIDNPLRLSQEEWERVVCVFVQGAAWQFKGWPWQGNPVDIFSKIAAFHLKYEEMKPDKNVAQWNVTILDLSRSKPHLDKASMLKFWDVLDRYMIKHKPGLRC